MKSINQFLFIIVAGYVVHLFLPFWSIALLAAVSALIFRKGNGYLNFGIGLLAGLILWGVMAWKMDSANLSLLSEKVGAIFKVAGNHLIYLSALIGALLSAFGALTGYFGAKLVIK